MNILVTGNLGYIGTVLTELLSKHGYRVYGYDIGYFETCQLEKTPNRLKIHFQIKKDIRHIEKSDLNNIDAIIHLPLYQMTRWVK